MMFDPVSLLIVALAVLAVFTVIVFVHEMGHYLVARWNGVAIQAFSIGFGPELFGFNDRAGTRWRVAAIPLGGYVRFVGDMNAASMPDDEASAAFARAHPELASSLFVNKNVWQRIAVVAAGPIANVLFTFLILYALLLGYGKGLLEPVIGNVYENSVAAEAGLLAGDRVLSVDGYRVRGFEDFQRYVSTAPRRQITVVVDRSGEQISLVMTPRLEVATDIFGNEQKIGLIGVERTNAPEARQVYRPGPVEAIGMTFEEIRFIIDRTVAFIGDFFVGRGDVEQLGGPIKVAQITSQIVELGLVPLISLAAFLSLNIGIFNLLPIPVLDGGHLLYYFAEAIRGRPLSPRVQEIGFRFGLAAILMLTVFTVYNDLF